ncbi:MAG TPA: hypothetical protein VMT99_01880 [Candidatus Paceibacterota bacterium]|nr:hypothetical protein [Candidatus Paceibacterota bacterium]
MNLFETLRQFKRIRPDASYADHSKRAILATAQNPVPMSPFRGILQFIETGAAVALAGFFILLITGAFSNSGYITPVQYSVIDAAGIHAEAQAIDMQIELSHLSYPDGIATSPAAFASRSTSTALRSSMAAVSPQAVGPAGTAGASSTAATTTVSVDQALGALSQ